MTAMPGLLLRSGEILRNYYLKILPKRAILIKIYKILKKDRKDIIMQIHESAEDYLESIIILKKQLGNVRSIDIVNYFDYSKPSISVAMKNLRMNGYVTVDSKGYIELTEKGSEIADKMYERHTLLTKWLTALGVDEKTAVEDACRIEHVISEESFEAIKKHIPAKAISE